jgi:hypothetical protein
MSYGITLQYQIESEEAVDCPVGFMSLDDRLHQINQCLSLFCEEQGMMFPV